MKSFDGGAGEEVDSFGQIFEVSLEPKMVLESEFRCASCGTKPTSQNMRQQGTAERD